MAKSFKDMIIPIKDLKIDLYQRELKPNFVKDKIKNFDASQVRPLSISEREDGSRYIIDGNHTRHILLGVYGEDATVMARIFYGLSFEEESEMFKTLNDNARHPSANEKIRASYLAKEPNIVNYVNALDANKIPYAFNKGENGKMVCHSLCLTLINVYDLETLIRALNIIKESYGPSDIKAGNPAAYIGPVVEGVTILLHYYRDKVKIDTLKMALSLTSPAEISASSKNGGSKSFRPARFIASKYNLIKRSRKLDLDVLERKCTA